MADNSNLHGENVKPVLKQFVEVGLHQRKNWNNETPTDQKKLVHVGMYFIIAILGLHFIVMCIYKWYRGRDLGWQVLLITVYCNTSTDINVLPFSIAIAYVDPGKRVGKFNTYPFSWHWPGDDESILLIVTLLVHTTILAIINAAIPHLPNPCRIIHQLWGRQVEPNGDVGPHTHNVIPIFEKSTAAGWVMVAMKLYNATPFCVVYCSQHANDIAGAQTTMRRGRS